MTRSCCARRIASASLSSFSIAESSAAPSDLTSWQISAAFWTSTWKRTSGSGWLTPLTTAATSSPAAAALASSAGSIGGSNSGSCRKMPWMLRLLRILKSRSATVSQ